MKVLLVVHKYPPFSTGGTEVYSRSLAAELRRSGYEVVVYFRADFDEHAFAARDEIIDGVRVHRVSAPLAGWRSFPLVEFWRTFRNGALEGDFATVLAKEQPDVVHFQHVMAMSVRLIPIARRMGYPVLLTLHDYWFLCSNSHLIWPDARVCQGKAYGLNCARCALVRIRLPAAGFLGPFLAPALQMRDALVRRAALDVQHLIAPSHFLMEQYLRAGFPADRFTYLENGLDVERIRRYPRQPPTDGQMRFTYLGSLAWQKGVHVLVEAFRGIPPEKATLRIYGDQTVFPDYAASLRQAADPGNTFLAGAVPNAEVGRVLAETDVAVVPSLWYENSPMVIQEAFAAGVPVVASRIGALAEKVRHDENGWLCPAGDVTAWRGAVLSLAEHPERVTQCLGRIPAPLTMREHTTLLQDIYERM